MQYWAKMLKKLREQKGLTQQEVAKKVLISQRSYSSYETGNREPNLETITRLAVLFDVPIDILVGRYTLPDSPKQMFNTTINTVNSINFNN